MQARKASTKNRRRRMGLESLELRQLLAVDLGLISFNFVNGQVTINGTPSNDRAYVSYQGGSQVAFAIETSEGTEIDVLETNQVTAIFYFAGDGDDTLLNSTSILIEAHGGNGNDELYGGAGNDRIYGGFGNDLINGGAGADFLGGSLGDDTMFGGTGPDQLFGESGNDVLEGNEDNDRLFGFIGSDQLNGGSGDDFVFGDSGNDLVNGGDGNDYVFGGSGDDELLGGAGIDRIFAGDGNDVADGGLDDDFVFGSNGNDVLAGNFGNDQLFGESGNDTLLGDAGQDRLFGGDDNDVAYGGADTDFVFGEFGNDLLHGDAGDDQVFGQEGDDTLRGGDGLDRLFGGVGNDLVEGGAQADYVFGEDGDDVVDGGDGDDLVYGSIGNDTLYGGAGQDALYGAEGNDHLDAGDGNDSLFGGLHDDVLYAGAGNDLAYGEEGNDILHGGLGFDGLIGNAGNDVLIGGADGDTLFGDDGNDILIGGAGVDNLGGFAGEDILNGGSTSYDYDDAALRFIIDAWGGPGDFQQRVQILENADFAFPLRSRLSVHDDGVVDELTGHDGHDWFFETGWLAGQVYGENDPPGTTVYTTLNALDNLRDIGHHEHRHTLIPHPHSPTMRRNHAAMLDLFDYRDVTHEAVQNGPWDEPSTWAGGVLPGDNARVLIPIGTSVTLRSEWTATLKTVRVDGELHFAPNVDTLLRVDTMLVAPDSKIRIGTPDQPIQANVTARIMIADTGPIDRVWDPFAMSRGVIFHGDTMLYGAPTTSHLPLAEAPLRGATQLQLVGQPTNWKVGDELVISGTEYGVEDHEVRVIRAINGATVTVDPLDFDHRVPKAGLQVHVANLTRNVVIESENLELSRRGHVMAMHTREIDINYAAFNSLGRTDKLQALNDSVVDLNGVLQPGTGTNQRGRYSLHFHRNGVVNDGNPSRVHGSVVNDSPGWGFVHHSSYVDFTNNVGFDVDGSAFVTEAGDEIGTYRNNIAIYSKGSGETNIIGRFNTQDFAHQGDGFWFQGPGLIVEENIATGQAGHGIVFFTLELIEFDLGRQPARFLASNLQDPSIANGAEYVPVGDVPIFSFRNNVAYDNKEGAKTRYHLLDKTHDQGTLIEDLLLWNNNIGMNVPYTNDTELRNIRIIHDLERFGDTGLDRNDDTLGVFYNNVSIEGYFFGMRVPNQSHSVIQGGYFQNVKNIIVAAAAETDRSLEIRGDVVFAEIPRDLLGVSTQSWIVADPSFPYLDHPERETFLNSVVMLNFGPFSNARLYHYQQVASYVPFPFFGGNIPNEYVGKTNQQLWDQYGIALGGAVAPADAIEVANVEGLVDLTP